MNLTADTLLNNRYRILSKLGQGGMGAVYLAMDTALEHPVAVKANLSPAQDSTNKFLREARLLASLRHSHLPRVTDYFILEGAQYLVMDYIPGKDLETVIKEEGAQPLEKVMDWARQLGSALSYLHEQEPPVIHRDIKPANVRLSNEGEAVLVDFGIAKVSNPTLSSTGIGGYTPGYAPPEQYSGSSRTGPYTDQYAFGALLYQLLTARRPVDSIQRVIGQAHLVPIQEIRPEIPAHVQATIEKALSLKPENRFNSVSDLLRSLTTPGLLPQPEVPPETIPAPPRDNDRQKPPSREEVHPPEQDRSATDKQQAASRRLVWPWITGAGVLALAVIAVLVLLLVFRGQFPPANSFQATSGSQSTDIVAAVPPPSETPQPPSPTVTQASSPTAQPSETPQPSPTHTQQPTNLPPTDTLAPESSATPTQPPLPTAPPLGQGGLVAFASDRAGDSILQIWTMRVSLNDQGIAEASDITQLTFSPGDKTDLAWSPDGKKLAYVSPGSAATGLDIWVMNADGSGEPANLTNKKGDDTEPAWSPDGQWISFTNNGREDKIRQVYLMHSDGSGLYRLSFDQEEFGTTWSPDMKWLGFVMNAAGAKIMFMRPPTDDKNLGASPYYATPERFDRIQVTGNLGQVTQPAWSPDGSWLAYTRDFGTKKQIWISSYPVKIPEKDVIRLTNGVLDTSPAWSPDSQWIVYSSKVEENLEIFVMRTNGQSQANLTLSPGRDLDPTWQILIP